MSIGGTTIEARLEAANAIRAWHRAELAKRHAAYTGVRYRWHSGAVPDPTWLPLSFEDLAHAVENGTL